MDVVYGSSGKPEPKRHGIEDYAAPGGGGGVPRGRDSNARVDVVFGTSGEPPPKLTAVGKAVVEVSGAVQKAVGIAQAISDSTHTAPLWAAWRQGADELAQVLTAFPPQGIQPVSEPGQLFEPTPQMVTEQIQGRMSLADLMQAGKEVEQARQQQKELER